MSVKQVSAEINPEHLKRAQDLVCSYMSKLQYSSFIEELKLSIEFQFHYQRPFPRSFVLGGKGENSSEDSM